MFRAPKNKYIGNSVWYFSYVIDKQANKCRSYEKLLIKKLFAGCSYPVMVFMVVAFNSSVLLFVNAIDSAGSLDGSQAPVNNGQPKAVISCNVVLVLIVYIIIIWC